MKRILIKYSLILSGYAAVICPVWVRMEGLSWSLSNDPAILFPFFGMVAFSILWLHSMSGVFEPWLRKYINFDRFVHDSSLIVLVCIILHPLLLLISLDFDITGLTNSGYANYIRLGIAGWLLLITYDIGKFLKRKYNFFVRNWNNILLISTIGFILTFFHSIVLGGDLQSGLLRFIWIFYGVTSILATIYTYGIKRWYKKSLV